MNNIDKFLKSINNKKIALCGLGVSNFPIAEKLLQYGAQVTVCDKKSEEDLGEMAKKLKIKNASFKTGEDYLKNIKADIIFRSPGISFSLDEFNEYRKNNIIITSEMEIFFEYCPAKIIGITGSDGKTTTSSIIYEMLKEEGKKVFLGGNIGAAMIPQLEKMDEDSYVVIELSSFQLISMRKSPEIAVVTNVAPNHLDIHKDYKEYIDAKINIFSHQNAFNKTVLNFDNDITNGFKEMTRGKTTFFSRKSKEIPFGAYVNDGIIYYTDGKKQTRIMSTDEINLPGEHNIENYLASITALWNIVSVKTMQKVAKTFKGVEHRIEFIKELDGVKYYNDSIASSPTRTIAGLKAFNKKIILIAGGYDKKIPFDKLGIEINKYVKHLILTGPTSEKIIESVKKAENYTENINILKAENLQHAAEKAQELAEPNDIVTLSPACASFDAFNNFAERGNAFKEIIKNLK